MELFAILFFGIAAMAAALLVIFSRNPVHSALWMVVNCFAIAVMFLLLNSQFIAILQIIVYAGAIMIFILYAIMMLNLKKADSQDQTKNNLLPGRLLILGLFFIGLLIMGIGLSPAALKGGMGMDALSHSGEVNLIAKYIFSKGLIPFELVSVLLTAAVVGAVYLARRSD